MKTWFPLAAAMLAIAVSAGADDVGKSVVDPVTNKALTVAKDQPSVVVNSNTLYFADAKNRETFLKAPETYLKNPLECPVRGVKGKANKANRVVVNDQIIYFCCGNCDMGFKKEPNNYVSKLIDPVSGKEFSLLADSPKVEQGKTIYFFESEDNKAAFEKEPAKYGKVKLQ
jgi:YHS domain-containing protein